MLLISYANCESVDGPMPAPESLPVPQQVQSMVLETCSDETLP